MAGRPLKHRAHQRDRLDPTHRGRACHGHDPSQSKVRPEEGRHKSEYLSPHQTTTRNCFQQPIKRKIQVLNEVPKEIMGFLPRIRSTCSKHPQTTTISSFAILLLFLPLLPCTEARPTLTPIDQLACTHPETHQ
jgi:hypothetical protein